MKVKLLSLLIFIALFVKGTWSSPDLPKECLNEIDMGPDSNWMEAYAFNSTENKCVFFWYGGSGGNENRFRTLDDCTDFCEPTCYLDIDKGPYYNWKKYYAFNRTEGKCVHFWYGGRGGNTNRFNTAKECTQFCKSDEVTEPWNDLFPNLEISLEHYSDLQQSSVDQVQRFIIDIVRSDIEETYGYLSEDLLIEVALAVDKIVKEYSSVKRLNYVEEVATKIKREVGKILSTLDRDGNIIGETSPPGLFKTLYKQIKSQEGKIKSLSDLKQFIKSIVLKEKGGLLQNSKRDIYVNIDDVVSQYKIVWRQYLFEIAHEVNYYVEEILAKSHTE